MISDDGIKTNLGHHEPYAEQSRGISPALLPLRHELFSNEQRRERARALARDHVLADRSDQVGALLARLADNERALRAVNRMLVDDVTAKKPITSVAEWLVDNFYVLEEQIGLVKRHLPHRYLVELPQLANPDLEGRRRVYDIAEKVIAFGDSRVDMAELSVVIAAYQEEKPLKLGELWAVPIMLRLALIENARRIADLVATCRNARAAARHWAEIMIEVDEQDPKNLYSAIARMADAAPELDTSFVAEFKRMLMGRGSRLKFPLQWIEDHLREKSQTIDHMVSEETHVQATLEISIRNCVNSLRGLNVTDWKEFVESMSLVEGILRQDPGDVYSRMDFATRDRYRRAVEALARKSGMNEIQIAEKCLELARAAAPGDLPANHVGHYLVGDGRATLREAVRYRGGVLDGLAFASRRMVLGLYLGCIAALTVVFTAAAVAIAHVYDVEGVVLLGITVLLAVSACHIAVGLTNFIATLVVKPHTMPRMNYAKGIPAEMRSLVAIPVIVSGEREVDALLASLEMHYLNNRGKYIHFALLTDFPDAPERDMPDDARLLAQCRKGVEELNRRYPEDGGDNFYLFHRDRAWNEAEGVWMGHERKRGKLEQLNRFLVHGDNAFSCVVGRTRRLSNVRYVITLDADTGMARDSAWQMVGAMAHPLQTPIHDARLGRVVKGHGILQPRVDSRLTGANRSHYARMCATEIGVDPYTRASSDVYQDLFDEGSFVGKGIYDVRVFDAALGGRFPDNKILSHDLLEGCVIRSGLLNDVKLYEDPPASYLADAARRHRWVRGDWQIASYLLAPQTRRDQASANPLGGLCQWKVFDNLRRSLTPIFLLLLLLLGLAVLTRPGVYLAIVCGVFVIPVLINALSGLVQKSPDNTVRQHVSNMAASTWQQAAQALFHFACLPYESYMNADAIIRSLWRQCVSHRHLLQWRPSDNSFRKSDVSLGSILARMWVGPALAVAMTVILGLGNRVILLYALPLFALWFASPFIVSWFSEPRHPHRERLTSGQAAFLRLAARRVWRFFEEFVGEGDNWLPPDNHQEFPVARTAHRTSPTNIGLSLLANLSARDFGWATAGALLDRTEKTLSAMLRLERYRGHFYNWYDTETLEVLRPAYISTVDSGNLAAHLLILGSGLRELAREPILDRRIFTGLKDCLDLAAAADGPAAVPEPLRAELARHLAAPPETLTAMHVALEALLAKVLPAAAARKTRGGEWLAAFASQCRQAQAELRELAPWADYLVAHPEWARDSRLDRIPTLADVENLIETLDDSRQSKRLKSGEKPVLDIPNDLEDLIEEGGRNAEARTALIQQLIIRVEDLAHIEYDFLYDKSKRLLAIGYNVDDRRLDKSYYDLLASEARLTAYLGVAQHKLPQASWFALGRILTMPARRPLLISWSGTMFEYLMPLLVMPTFEDTLLDETYRAAVAAQIDYGAAKGVPWGVSESGFYVFDADQNYQYRAFGVPELGLKHGRTDDLVVAPYAAALAAMVLPATAVGNLERLDAEGMQTDYGFYEAVDFTPSRLPHGGDRAVVRSYMAHHQGMSLVAFGQVLLDRPMHRRFDANPLLHSAVMLLQEMAPTEKAMYYHSIYSPELRPPATGGASPVRVLSNPNSAQPEVQLLANNDYRVMISAAGGGYSRWRDFAVTRWREDVTRDNWGTFCYVRDLESGEVWSNTLQPALKPAKKFQAVFSEGKAEFNRRERDIEIHTEVVVSPEDDVEVRRLRITNRTDQNRDYDVTSYAEVVLNRANADDSHQAFSKLFVQTEIVRNRQAIVCSRRPRSREEKTPLMFHLLAVRGVNGGDISYESDRMRFIGRARTAVNPRALDPDCRRLSDSEGAVLDPVVAVRSQLTIESGDTAIVDIVTGVAESREALFSLMEKYQDHHMAEKAFDLAWTHGQVVLRQLNASEADAQLYCKLAGSIIYPNPALRAPASVIVRNHQGQSRLWGYAISGDLPIVLLRIEDPTRLELVAQLIHAHSYWRQKGLLVDLVIWNEDKTSYRQDLHDQITGLAGAALGDSNIERPGGIFIRSTDRIPPEDQTLIATVARLVVSDSEGLLEDQLRRQIRGEIVSSTTIVQYARVESRGSPRADLDPGPLVLANSVGGFRPDGSEYVMTIEPERTTPLPWVNVIANPCFGTVVSESGSAYTWQENAHEFRLTPWNNDPVSDSGGEAIYLRDDMSGDFWSPTPLPCPSGNRFVVRHGFGYSVFEHVDFEIRSELTEFVDMEDAVKYFVLKLRNDSAEIRHISVTGYAEWVLGNLRSRTSMHVVTGVDSVTGALFARNHYIDEFRGRTAFLDSDDPARTVTSDRRDFLGRNGSPARPFALQRVNLSGRVGPGLDPCGALQVKLTFEPGQERTVVLRLGVGGNVEEARKLVKRHRGENAAAEALARVTAFWRETLGAVRVETPDQPFDIMANGWLLYQTLSCRFWGRSGFYQSGGAFGFRDQLQDSMALLYSRPDLVRRHLVESARHQFMEGDVMHWWHPPAGRGVRTRCSDDYLWLPHVAEKYVTVTGDKTVLEETAAFIQGRPVPEGEESYYDLPSKSDQTGTLYEHCRRAILHGMRLGERGLPLMGTGDWNDGMDLVGKGGKGESVWLAFFLYDVLKRFEKFAEERHDNDFVRLCREESEALRANIEAYAWDDAWYRRAYFDDGTPLGSDANTECRIDSIAQSWAVLSGAGGAERAAMAMKALYVHLVDRDHKLIKLFEPPFDKSDLNPGYIKGYVPGVRENGGQYTHAAIWAGMAFVGLGDRRKAWELFTLLNPVNHGVKQRDVDMYMDEPYVVAADIYTNPQHAGRGGWSWYTGSASWLYRFMLEGILGFRLEGDRLRLAPCIPPDWKGFTLRFRHGRSRYLIDAGKPAGSEARATVYVDGAAAPDGDIHLVDDGAEHTITLVY